MNNYWKSADEARIYKNKAQEDEIITVEGVKKYLSHSDDIVLNPFFFGGTGAHICCIDGLVNDATIDENILSAFHKIDAFKHCTSQKKAVELIEKGFVNHSSYRITDSMKALIEGILSANYALIFENEGKAVIFDAKGFEKRSIEQSDSEAVLKGSKDAFSEPIRVNTAILRRHIKSNNLVIRQINIGSEATTIIAIAYMKNMAEPDLVEAVEKRIKSINDGAIVSAGQIEAALDGFEHSIFPKVLYTERADKLAANILNGRVGVLIDGYPVSYICPSQLAMFLQAPEDYSDKAFFSSFIRFIRYLCLALSIFTPALYIAIVNYDCEIIPSKLAMSIMESRQGVPFEPFVEVIIMLIAFEILIESGLRLPKGIGQTVSIVAGLIIGEAAIEAGLVSPAVVMVTAISGVTVFVIPYQDFEKPIRIIRLIMLIFAQLGGLFGVASGFILLLLYLNSIESFSLPYFAPFSSDSIKKWLKDTIIRGSLK